MSKRFTIDGSAALEERIEMLCAEAVKSLLSVIPEAALEAVVLGGGYGRGEGGVLRTPQGEEPYNDLEYYVFVRGNRLLNMRRYASPIAKIEDALSLSDGLHVEFKIESLPRFRRNPVSMFSYDLVSAHRVVYGRDHVFSGCDAHRKPDLIPLAEATRLLFNRATGLLLAQRMLSNGSMGAREKDFVCRNVAKAQLALGDAVLTASGLYHWSCRERLNRLTNLSDPKIPNLETLQRFHREGVAFKLHPFKSEEEGDELLKRHEEVSTMTKAIWLWLETKRLNVNYSSPVEYSADLRRKCPEQAELRNILLNFRTFGLRALAAGRLRRYPRERLMNALPLLLWGDRDTTDGATTARIQRELCATSTSWSALVSSYHDIWPQYG